MFKSTMQKVLGRARLTATLGVIGGIATSGVVAAEAPAVAPTVDTNNTTAANEAATLTGTYEACSALFPSADKSNLAVLEYVVEAGTGELPDPLPSVGDELTPVVIFEIEGEEAGGCVPTVAWSDLDEQLAFIEFFPGTFADTEAFFTSAGSNHLLIPVPEGTIISATLSFEHDLGDELTVSSAPVDITDDLLAFYDIVEPLVDEETTAFELVVDRLNDNGYTAEATTLEEQFDGAGCTDRDAQLEALADAVMEVYGIASPTIWLEDQLGICDEAEIASLMAAYAEASAATLDNLPLVTVTIDGPAAQPTTTVPATTPSTTIATGALPATGSTSESSAMIAAILLALGTSGVLISRRRVSQN